MKRSILTRFLAVAAIAVLISSSGCKAPTVQYPILQSATLRVMNFAPNCTSPMDVYWGPASSPIPNKAIIFDLKYGAASVYTTSIQVAAAGTPYLVVVRPTRDTTKEDIQVPITLMPSGKYTIVVTHDPNNPALFIATILTDAVLPSGSDPSQYTFVRFMNLQPNVGSYSVHVNDPSCGDAITSGPEAFNNCTPYIPLKTQQDTSYAFYMTDTTNTIINKLTYQTFVSGSYYTIVYGGDLCNTPLDNPADTINDADDSLRLRVFDDNDNGADQTNPPPLTYRYNIINAVTPRPGVSIADVGYTVNGADFPEYYNFSVPPIPMDDAGGSWAQPSPIDGNILNVYYQSATIPPSGTSVPVTAERTDATGDNLGQLFSASMTETSTLDSAIMANHSVSFLYYDTVSTKLTSAGKSLVFSVPDQSYPDMVTLVFVPAVFGAKQTPVAETYFYYSINGVVTPSKWNASSGTYYGNLGRTGKPTVRIPLSPGTSEQITIIDTVTGTAASGKIGLPSKTFTAEAGGIYEIVAVGDLSQQPGISIQGPGIPLNNLIMRVNAPPGQ